MTTSTWTGPGGVTLTLETRPDTNDWNVCQSVIGHDEYGFGPLAPLTGTAVDVGAHIGSASVALLALNPDLRVVAIEPIPENAALLRQNLAPYGDRAIVLERAAGEGDQTIAYGYTGDDEFARIHRFIGNTHVPAGTGYTTVTVPGVTLADLVRDYGPITLIKMDCEGCEAGFLEDELLEDIPHVVGEIHYGPAVRPITPEDRKPKRRARKPATVEAPPTETPKRKVTRRRTPAK